MALALGGFCPHQCLNPNSLFLPSISSNPLLLSLLPPCHTSLIGAKLVSSAHHIKLKHSPKSSAEEVSGELTEDPKFVPLNADDPVYGPPALLLLGFEVEEAVKIRQFLKEFDGEFLQLGFKLCCSMVYVIFCTEDMIPRSLWDAVHTSQPNLESVKIAKSLPRICFLSGLTGEEMMMFIDAFPETGLEPAVFAALVPNSADKPLQELIDEIMGDHEMMTAKEHSST